MSEIYDQWKRTMSTDKNYVNLCCHKMDADTIEKIRRTYTTEKRRTPSSVSNTTHQMLGAYLYCKKHNIIFNNIWYEKEIEYER